MTRLSLNHLSKSYGPLTVLSDLTLSLDGPGIYCLMAPSGAGKTTLFRLILGLEKPDAGEICLETVENRAGPRTVIASAAKPDASGSPPFSSVFQEDRLIEHMTPVENLRLILGAAKKQNEPARLRRELAKLLPEESLDRPASTLSGGMRRRLSFLRAMMAPSGVVLMDEPFTGLDEGAKELMIRYLLEHSQGRLFLIATHAPEDVKRLGAVLVTLPAHSL